MNVETPSSSAVPGSVPPVIPSAPIVEAGPGAEKHVFQAEVNQLLRLVVHSLYSHPEVFLRELVSNASDALDKLRFEAVTQPELLGGSAGDVPLEIRLIPDAAAGTLSIEDTGIGMDKDALVRELGTIAHSGTKAFLDRIAAEGKTDTSLIGQFGVGFYSAFLVADQVEVHSRRAGTELGHRWLSDAKGAFTLEPSTALSHRGTRIVLHLKPEHREFLQSWKLRELVQKYSDFVGHPIVTRDETGKSETLNKATALWQRPKSELDDAAYGEFYKHLTHDFDEPLAWTHFRVEGNQQFTGLLYLPKNPPFDLDTPAQRRGVRLFVRRVFIMDDCEELLPPWLRFVRGVVDSDDLPLNVSRELLQDSKLIPTIRKQVVKKVLDLLEKTAKEKPEEYATFWASFGKVLKEGLTGYDENKDRLAGLVRFESSKAEGFTSLADAVTRMKEGQPALYYVYGESKEVVASSPHLESLNARGYEVLYLTDPIDEWVVRGIGEFEGKKLVSVMEADLNLGSDDAAKKALEEEAGALQPLLEKMRAVLQASVKEVRVSERLTDSPVCLVMQSGSSHAYLERLMKERGREVHRTKRTLEINPKHPLITKLAAWVGQADAEARLGEWIELLYEQALLTEGSALENPNLFARRLSSLLTEIAGAKA